MVNLDMLTEVYQSYLEKENLPQICALELMYGDLLTSMQRNVIEAFYGLAETYEERKER